MYIKDVKEVPSQEGEVGIEIEVEGEDLPPEGPLGWRKEEDGSLRGESGEFVLERPCSRNSVGTFLSRIYDAYEENESYIVASPRQSVHIHINVQDVPADKIFNYILLFLMFEPMLVRYCGEGRSNNLFCLRSSDAEYLLTSLEKAAASGSLMELGSDALRYSAINVNALFKYGSLEFRSMRGATDQKTLEDWVGMLLKLKDFAISIENPKELLAMFRSMDTFSFAQSVFGEYTHILYNSESQEEMIESARSVKMIAYMGDWDKLRGDRHPASYAAAFSTAGIDTMGASIYRDIRRQRESLEGIQSIEQMLEEAAESEEEEVRMEERLGRELDDEEVQDRVANLEIIDREEGEVQW